MTIQHNRFYRYEAFTAILQQLVRDYPRLLSIESIGKSHEGRDIWVLTATNQDTGAAKDKPALPGYARVLRLSAHQPGRRRMGDARHLQNHPFVDPTLSA